MSSAISKKYSYSVLTYLLTYLLIWFLKLALLSNTYFYEPYMSHHAEY